MTPVYDVGGVTDGRQTYVTFSDYIPGPTQAWVATQRQSEEMGRSQAAILSNVVNLPHIGWQLLSYQLSPGDAAWSSAAQAGNITVSNGLQVPPNYAQPNTFAQQDIDGVVYASGVQTLGSGMNVHRPPTGTNWAADCLTADQTAFPSPNTEEDPTQMLRVGITPLYPVTGSISPGQNITFSVYFPSSVITPRTSIATFYFNGPAGDAPVGFPAGTGQYSLKVKGDGYAYLYELSKSTELSPSGQWIPRYHFRWGSSGISWTLLSMMVHSLMWQDQNGNWCGSALSFNQTKSNISPSQMAQVATMAELQSTALRFQHGLVPTYYVPRLTSQPMTICPVRIDTAIDSRVQWAIAKHVYQPSGTISDDLFSFDQPVTQSRPLQVVWSGVCPDGTSWSVQLYDQSGNICSAASTAQMTTTPQGQTVFQNFTPNANMSGGYLVFTLTASSDRFSTPTLTQWSVYGEPIYQSSNPVTPITIPNRATPPSLWEQVIESVDLTPQTTDPGAENATIVVNDFTGQLDSLLEYVNFIPIHVWCTDPSLVSNPKQVPISIFRGYILKANGKRMRTEPGQIYPNKLWTVWNLECTGEWARVQDSLLPRRQIWQNQATGQNGVVTNIVYNMLTSVYPTSDVIVPSSSIQLFGTSADTWTSEPGMRVGDLCQNWMQDYFGGWCLFDEGARTQGSMRAFFQKLPPYNNLAVFEIDHPTLEANDSIPRLPQMLGSYGYTTGAGGQIVQHAFIQAGTFEPHTERAEGNCVTLYGGGPNPDAQKALGADATSFTQFAINVKSFNFLNLSPGQPGYPDGSDPSYFGRVVPIRVFNYSLPTQNAVNWYCRRVFDRACYARYYLSFMAPLLYVTDITDIYQSRPRRLHYDDPVLVRQYDGSLRQFLVVSCSPSYVKDHIQMAHYMLVTQANISTRAVIPISESGLKSLMKAQSRMKGIDTSQSPETYSSQKQGAHINTQVMGLPTPSAPPIQDFNPNSPTFGQFLPMAGYPGN